MVTDIDLDENLDVHLDGGNDLATTSGVEQLQQSIAIDVLSVTDDFVGEGITGKEMGLIEEQIRRSLQNDEQVTTIRSISIDRYDRGTETIAVDISVVGQSDFTMELSV